MSVPTIVVRRERTITQTVRLAETTYTSHITLGVPSQATQDPAPAPVPTPDTSLTDAQLGGIIGGVLGSVLLLLVIWCCLVSSRRRKRQEEEYYIDETGYDSEPSERQYGYEARYERRVPTVPIVPPPPAYMVNRSPPWDPVYSGPKRNLPRRRER